jgi:hypothetical protein
MLQSIPEVVWSFWQLVGIVVALPFVLYLLSKAKEWVPLEKFEAEEVPIGFLGRMMAVVLTPLLLGEAFAVIAGIILYPEFSNQTLLRGFRLYLVAFGSISVAYIAVTLHNRGKRKTREVSEDLS